jgi:hypothetical protein
VGTGASRAQGTALTPRWTHVSGAENWVGRAVALGNEGTEVFSNLEAGALIARLFTQGTPSPAVPLWQVQDSSATFQYQIAACESRSLHASARVENAPGGGQRIAVRGFGSGASQPLWTWTTPPQTSAPSAFLLAIPDAGNHVLFAFHTTSGLVDVKRIHAQTGTVANAWSVQLYAPPTALLTSVDGASVYLASPMMAAVVDAATGAVQHQAWITTTSGRSHGFSGDGRAFAFGVAGEVRVFRRNVSGAWGAGPSIPLASSAVCDTVAISRDGSRLVAGWLADDAGHSVWGTSVDLPATFAAGSAQVRWSRLLGSAPAYQNQCADVRVSADGRTCAFGLWGDNGGPAPELVVVTGDGADAREAALPGSVQRLSLSADGRHLAAGSKSVHNTMPQSDGRIDYYELGADDLVAEGIPHAGGSVSLRVRATPGTPVVLLASSARAIHPLDLGPVGDLHLARTAMLPPVALGSTDGSGLCVANLPLAGAAVGTSVWLQALAISPRRLTHDYVKLTIVP